MKEKPLKILGTGAYIPKCKITKDAIKTENKHPEITTRYFVSGETSSEMGAHAAKEALKKANLEAENVDLILSLSGTQEQPIPCQASLIHKKLGLEESGIPAFDINATCLSFLAGLDVAAEYLSCGKYQRILLVSSEIASKGLHPEDPYTNTLFGDGAAAAVVERNPSGHVKGSLFETYSKTGDACGILGGGTKLPGSLCNESNKRKFYFQMQGKKLFKALYPKLSGFFQKLYQISKVKKEEIKLFIPHQASPSALKLLTKKLGFSAAQTMNIVQEFGNTIAASLPLALHFAIERKKIQRGDHVLLFGTSAGLSLGGLILEY